LRLEEKESSERTLRAQETKAAISQTFRETVLRMQESWRHY